MNILAKPTVSFMVLLTGMLLFLTCVATLVAVIDLAGEVETNRRFDCISRDLNGLATAPGCKEYLDDQQ